MYAQINEKLEKPMKMSRLHGCWPKCAVFWHEIAMYSLAQLIRVVNIHNLSKFN
jgi:hypothetical protein